MVGLDGCQNQVPAKGDTLSSKSAVSLLVDKRQAVVTEQEDLQRHITNAQEVQCHALNIDSEQAGARMSSTSITTQDSGRKIPSKLLVKCFHFYFLCSVYLHAL